MEWRVALVDEDGEGEPESCDFGPVRARRSDCSLSRMSQARKLLGLNQVTQLRRSRPKRQQQQQQQQQQPVAGRGIHQRQAAPAYLVYYSTPPNSSQLPTGRRRPHLIHRLLKQVSAFCLPPVRPTTLELCAGAASARSPSHPPSRSLTRLAARPSWRDSIGSSGQILSHIPRPERAPATCCWTFT